MKAELLNLAGRVSWGTGKAIDRVGALAYRAAMPFFGLAGTLDAMADSAGYLDTHELDPATGRFVRRPQGRQG